ncbi:MAG: FkbM family methyltransferase [Verrucomicrobia bacterium]|nr:FkbM family methyltransferase [Verrucomicrobiota bacterium]
MYYPFFSSLLLIFIIPLSAIEYPYRFEGAGEEFQKQQLDLISLFLPQDPIILEIGAYCGAETVSLATKWPLGTVIAFEPNPSVYPKLMSSTQGFYNIETYNLAASNITGEAPFYICHGTHGKDPSFEHASSLLPPSNEMRVHYEGPVITVPTTLLDTWCKENLIQKVDFMRLDLQGAELQVLQSSPEILKSVQVISLETYFFPFRLGTTMYRDLRQFLEAAGFRLLSHWYREGLQGQAIFIKNEAIDFEHHNYQKCYIPDLQAYFFVDDIPDGIKWHLKQGIYWESGIGNLIKQYVKEGTLALDIGAHIGIHTVTMSRKVGPKGTVIAFEPQKKMLKEQLQNLKANGCKNVISTRKALGETYKNIEMCKANPFNEGGTTIGEGGDKTEMIPLDSLHLQNISLIKMDVERTELYVLQGARETLLRNKPIIIFEVLAGDDYLTCSDAVRKDFKEIFSFVEALGYKVELIFGNDYLATPL